MTGLEILVVLILTLSVSSLPLVGPQGAKPARLLDLSQLSPPSFSVWFNKGQ